MLPQTNARLRTIAGRGFTAEADLPETTGDPKWAGNTGVYVNEKVVASTAGARLDHFRKRYIVIPGDLRPPVEVEPGDVLTYFYAGQQRTGRVENIEAHLMSGVTPTVRLYFQDV